jgi:PIN domain nuclease of toxin-antitoxin system
MLVANSSNPSLRKNWKAGSSGVRLLLDTHAPLWWLIKSPWLPVSAQNLLRSRQNTVPVSAASAWEMATKVRLGKLYVAAEVVENFTFCQPQEEFDVIPVTVEHGIRAGLLRDPHISWSTYKDPFSAAHRPSPRRERPLVSNDRALDGYAAKRLWQLNSAPRSPPDSTPSLLIPAVSASYVDQIGPFR